jgi:phage tail-like protein
MSQPRKDPLPVFCFKVTITGAGSISGDLFFKSVTGLKSETEVVDYKEGGINDSTKRLVGSVKWPNVVLKKGFTGDVELADWREQWLRSAGTKSRATVTIQAVKSDLTTVVGTWTINKAWPCKWEGPDYDASKNELAIESIELAHEGLTYSK